jgi:hypothetical protein
MQRHRRREVWRRLRAIWVVCRRASVLSLLVILATSLASPASAGAALKAPGLQYGPTVLHQGLLWSGASGVLLSGAAGTHLLVPELTLPDMLVNDRWTVAADLAEFKAGKNGSSLAPIPALQLCRPIPARDGSWLDALSGENLYVVVQGGCMSGVPGETQVLVQIGLNKTRVQRIVRIRAGAVSLSVAEHRLALTYLMHQTGPPSTGVRVDVLDSSTMKLLYRLTAPGTAAQGAASTALVTSNSREATPVPSPRFRGFYTKTQLDTSGDVLVTGVYRLENSQTFASGWWGNARTRATHSLGPAARGTLSDGHIAYVASRGGVEHIDVFNLATRATRTEVELRGSARVTGVGLRKDTLAWAQQAYGYTSEGPHSCNRFGPVGEPELSEIGLSVSGPPIVVNSSSAVRPAGPPCVIRAAHIAERRAPGPRALLRRSSPTAGLDRGQTRRVDVRSLLLARPVPRFPAELQTTGGGVPSALCASAGSQPHTAHA